MSNIFPIKVEIIFTFIDCWIIGIRAGRGAGAGELSREQDKKAGLLNV